LIIKTTDETGFQEEEMSNEERSNLFLETGIKFNDSTRMKAVPGKKKTTYLFINEEGSETSRYQYTEPLTLTMQCTVGKEIKRHLNPGNAFKDSYIADSFEKIKMALKQYCDTYEISRENNEKSNEEQIKEELQANMEEAKEILESRSQPLLYIASLVGWLTAGEKTNIMLTFICYCSQIILRNPISVIAIGDGGSGKTHIEKEAMSLIPSQFIVNEKKVTEAAMFNRAKENPYFYDGKIVNYGDLGNDPSQKDILEAKNMLKEMQTEGFLNKPLSVPDPEGGWVTRILGLFGFPCLTYTTVPGFKFDDQEMSRSIFITPRTNNKKVFNAMKSMLEMQGKTYREYKHYKKEAGKVQYIVYLLRQRMENIEIINPYTEMVINFLGDSEYFKRDFDKYNGILKTITAFNGYNRELFEMDGKQVLFTSLDDIQFFISLLSAYHDSISGNITPKAAEVLDEIRANFDDWLLAQKTFEQGITTPQYAELSELNLSKRSIQKYFSELNRTAFLKVVDQQGRANVYALTGHVGDGNINDFLKMSESQKEMIKFEIGRTALDFILCDEAHEGLTISLHDQEIGVPGWEIYD